jgi:hypothetical protein
LAASDDSYFKVRRVTLNGNVQVEFECTSPLLTASQIAIRTEARVSSSSLHQTIEAFNFATGLWTPLDDVTPSQTDQVRTVAITSNVANYIEGGTRRMRVRLGFGEQSQRNVRWIGSIDQVQWTLTP